MSSVSSLIQASWVGVECYSRLFNDPFHLVRKKGEYHTWDTVCSVRGTSSPYSTEKKAFNVGESWRKTWLKFGSRERSDGPLNWSKGQIASSSQSLLETSTATIILGQRGCEQKTVISSTFYFRQEDVRFIPFQVIIRLCDPQLRRTWFPSQRRPSLNINITRDEGEPGIV